MEDIRSRSDGVATQIQTKTCFLSSGNQSVGSSLVSCNIHISSRHLLLRFDAISCGNTGMGVMTIVETSLHHLDVVLGNSRLLGELLTKEISHQVQVAVEQPADQSEGEHITALEHGLVIHTGVGQAFLHHGCQRTLDHSVGINTHLSQIILCLESGLLQIVRTKRVCIYDNGSLRLGVTILSLQCGGIHRNENIAQITRGIDFTCTDMYLESAHTCQ